MLRLLLLLLLVGCTEYSYEVDIKTKNEWEMQCTEYVQQCRKENCVPVCSDECEVKCEVKCDTVCWFEQESKTGYSGKGSFTQVLYINHTFNPYFECEVSGTSYQASLLKKEGDTLVGMIDYSKSTHLNTFLSNK